MGDWRRGAPAGDTVGRGGSPWKEPRSLWRRGAPVPAHADGRRRPSASRATAAPTGRRSGLVPGAEREWGFGAFTRGLRDAERTKTPSGAGANPAASRASPVTRPASVPQGPAPGLNHKLRSCCKTPNGLAGRRQPPPQSLRRDGLSVARFPEPNRAAWSSDASRPPSRGRRGAGPRGPARRRTAGRGRADGLDRVRPQARGAA